MNLELTCGNAAV